MKQCAVYTRVSTDTQAEKEYNSCQSQEEKIRAFIDSQDDWRIYDTYSDEGYSGASLDRPAFSRMLSDIDKIDIILFYKMDRLTRSPKDFYHLVEVFENADVDIISITERFDTSTPSGRLLRNIMLTFGQFERELTSERTRDKMHERARKGLWNGGSVPYGYENQNKRLVINKKEAETVNLIYDTFLETESLFKTYRKMRELEITGRNGKPFPKSAIFYMLRNTTYTGKINYSGTVYPGKHQPIIDEEVFNLAQKFHRKRFLSDKLNSDCAFAGLVTCGDCGRRMTATYSIKSRDGKKTKYRYYRCTNTLKQDWNDCSVKQINSERLEDYVFENLQRISNDFPYIDNLIFRLNHTAGTRRQQGFEPAAENEEFSAKFFQNRLKKFLRAQDLRSGVKKNLFIRKHIQEIIYSKENIRINFIYSDSGVNSDDSRRKKFSEDLRGGAEENKARRAEISDTKSGINNYCGLTSGNDLLKMAENNFISSNLF